MDTEHARAPVSTPPRAATWGLWLGAAGIVAAALLCYAGKLSGPFIFDDEQAIVANPSLQPFSLARALSPPRETPVAARPFANLSFAVDRALWGLSPRAFHATNLLIHTLCALLVFVALRRLLHAETLPRWLRAQADESAWLAALLFCVHPLGAEVVLYATQRTESLAALCYLAAVWLLARDAQRDSSSWPWAFALGMVGVASKEVFATAPFVVLCCDRAFFAGSFRGALRVRARYHAALALPLVLLALLQRGDPRPGSVRFAELDYLLAQARIVPGYFAETLWPAHPAIDYGPLWPQRAAALWPWIALSALLLAVALALAWSRPRLSFPVCWVFAILAPSSSVFSIRTEVGADRRFYLPSVALLAGCAIALVALVRFATRGRARLALPLGVALAALLCVRTRAYATSFGSTRSVWETAARARPDNARAHYNLAETLRRAGDVDGAIASLRAALAAHEAYADAHMNLAGLLIVRGARVEGLAHARRAVALAGQSSAAHENLALALAFNGMQSEALAELEVAVRLAPDDWEARRKLVRAYLAAGQLTAALPHARALAAHDAADPWARRVFEAAGR